MFTGLIQDIGTVKNIDKSRGDWRIEIETNLNLDPVQIGASVACSGACLSVIEKSKNTFKVDVSKESLDKTIIGAWQVMTRINIEPSLKLSDEIGGHLVSGHVDGVTEILDITPEGDSHRLKIKTPDDFKAFIAPKGSITLDGISLTVNEVEQEYFGVNIIPHTWEHTTLGDRKAGDKLNLEIDTIARYVARQMQFRDI